MVDNHQISSEDPLVIYHPFLDEHNHVLEKAGEAATMQRFARDTQFVGILQSAFGSAFYYMRDISKLSPQKLVGFTSLVTITSYGKRRFFLPPDRWNRGYVDFAEDIPSTYIDWLLSRPHPFDQSLSDLFILVYYGAWENVRY